MLLVSLVLGELSPAFGSDQISASPQVYTREDWSNWATTAWHYYDPGVGVNAQTGLHRANLGWACFTDWDLGAHIYSIILARKLGLIADSSDSWQFRYRIDKVLTFLEKRPLGSSGGLPIPFWSYKSDAMNPFQACSTGLTNPADSGRLLAALYALKVYSPTYTSRVDAIYARTKPIYEKMAKVGSDYYGYLAAEGFAAFGADESAIFNVIDNYPESGDFVSTGLYGQSLPTMDTISEPILIAILEADSLAHPPTSRFLDFAKRAYLAQSGRFSDTHKLTAWSEGFSPPSLAPSSYVYEFIVCGTAHCTKPSTWIVQGSTTPLAFTKVAFAYLAIYGETPYTLALVNVAKNLLATAPYSGKGFGEATLENGGDPGFPTGWGVSDKTNELVLAAAYRALSTLPEISLQPTSGPPGTNVAVSGSKFAGGDTSCTISSSPSGLISNPQCAVSGGVVSGSFKVGSGASGPYSVTVTGTSGDVATVSFSALGGRTLTLTPDSGQVGTVVAASGSNFAGTSCVLSSSPGGLFTSSSCSISAGTLSGGFTVGSGATVGSYTLTATSNVGSTDSASASFSVTSGPPATFSMTPTSGLGGTVVVVSGQNYAGTTCNLSSAPSGLFTSSTCSISSGTLSGGFTVASGASLGGYTVTVMTNIAGETKTAQFVVTSFGPQTFSLSPSSGPDGTSVSASGQNYAGATCSLTSAPSGLFTSQSCTISGGTVSGGFTVATGGSGGYTVAITTNVGETKTAQFTVVSPAVPTFALTPASGVSGTAVTISGANYAGVTCTMTSMPSGLFASSSCVISAGRLSGGFTVADDAPDGSYTVAVETDAGLSDSASSTFMVEPILGYAARISGVVVVPDPLDIGQGSKVIFTVNVQNAGTVDISSAKVQLKIYRPGSGTPASSLYKYVAGFKAGTERTVQVTYTLSSSAPVGDWTCGVYVYRGSTLLDQVTDQGFTVKQPVKTGKIGQSPVTANPNPVGAGGATAFIVTFENTGNIIWSTAKLTAKIYKPDSTTVYATRYLTVSNIAPNLEYSRQVKWTPSSYAILGDYTYDATLTYGSLVLDSSTGNTVTVEPIVRTGEITSVTDAPDPVVHGETATVTVTAMNTGNSIWSSGRVVIRIYKPDGKTLYTTRYLSISNIAPNVDYTFNVKWAVSSYAPTGTYTYNVYFYYGTSTLKDSDEGNPSNTITVVALGET